MSVPQLRAILWCAVSDEKQAKDEKASLIEQERLLRERAKQEGWLVVDVLIVPGFSRRFYNYPEFKDAASAQGIDAPQRLMEHWKARDFDVLACRYGSRFAREQSIFGEVVARTIDMGARIFTLQDGWVDRNNYRMFISMGGYAASKEVDELQQRFQDGMNKRAERGLPVSAQVVISHKVLRDELGRAQKLVVNEERRRLFDDLASVLLTGISWAEIPNILYEQYGHATSKGKPWSVAVLWRTVHSPWFWGHGARHYADSFKGSQKYGIWGFDPSVPPPPGAIVFRDTHEPMYTGELAIQVMNELKRRSELITGRAGYGTASPFSGLLICGSCGYRLRYKRPGSSRWEGYTCVSVEPRFRFHPRHECKSNPRTIKMSVVREWVTARLKELLDSGDLSSLLPDVDEPLLQPRIEALKGEIERTERRIEGLLLQRADTPAASQNLLTGLIIDADQQLANLRNALATAEQQQLESSQQRKVVAETIAEIKNKGLKAFWEQENPVINRMLYSLLGEKRIVVLDGMIVGIGIPNHL